MKDIYVNGNVMIDKRLSSNGKSSNWYYIPEFNRYVRYESGLKSTLINHNIDYLEWKTKWYLDMDKSLIGTEIWADKMIDVFYNDKFSDTKQRIKENLLVNYNYELDFFITKKDLISIYYKTRNLTSGNLVNYDFQKVPEFIHTSYEKFQLICLEINPFTKDIYGDYWVDYNHLIILKRDHRDLSNIKAGYKRSCVGEEDCNLKYSKIVDDIDLIKTRIINGETLNYISSDYNITSSQLSKLLRNRFNITARVLNNFCKSSGELIIREFLELHNITYQEQVTIHGISGRHRDYVRIDFSVQINKKVIWIEYNGIQHYEYCEFFYKTRDEFFCQVTRDKNLKEYCKNNSIVFIELPYILKTKDSIFRFLTKTLFQDIESNTLIDYNKLFK